MNAKDLMIGDWVIFKVETPKMCKVVSIDTDNGSYIRQSLTDTYYTEDCFEPIPLTEEILKKNGFNKHVFGFSIQEFRLYGNLSDNNLVYFTINFDKMEIRIDYVHELQHALKMCGIEKEIIL